ncbi:MAG: hypothetical protein CL912_12300 [Deltaproteobacteria bacterium]|nr:hypothetical protein [Deltaproteobacteria bacterium]
MVGLVTYAAGGAIVSVATGQDDIRTLQSSLPILRKMLVKRESVDTRTDIMITGLFFPSHLARHIYPALRIQTTHKSECLEHAQD